MPSNQETNRSTKVTLWIAGILALLLLAIALRFLTRERVAVRVGPVAYAPIIKTTSTNGKVLPVEDFQAHAQAPGVVQAIYVALGDKVRPGELLIRMDDADARARLASALTTLTAARNAQADIAHGGTQDERNTNSADLTRTRLQLEQDQNALASLQKLASTGAASQAEVAAARQRILADQNSLNAVQQHATNRFASNDLSGAQARIADAEAAVAAAKAALANVNIHSPLAGSIYSLPVAQYDYVTAGEDLIYIADLNRVHVTAYFDEPEIGNLAVGQPVKIVWEAKPGKVWHGHIVTAPTTVITYGTRNVGECIINVDDARGELLPNTNVTVTVTTAQKLRVLTAPREAVHTDSNQQSFVFRVLNGKLIRTPVQVGIYNQNSEEIVSGLSEGDAVVLTPATAGQDLIDGMSVTVVP
ncbi:MAG: efflux RND transporter periplasmic adaptor subunit [Acidobacteriota bacterium]|nr:efflux RND transporter periplasmic adaptor subunit [Acidobacteriota bacterium]